ncbi:hypothetical protein A7982_12614 [Minicystis rosea]|nr:hypothetical protein A7982_12614 [Minicystis rosea]
MARRESENRIERCPEARGAAGRVRARGRRGERGPGSNRHGSLLGEARASLRARCLAGAMCTPRTVGPREPVARVRESDWRV